MNLLENILSQMTPKEQFFSGFKPTQPVQAPPTQPQQAPQVPTPKPKMTLFKDEYTMLGKMKADGLGDDEAMGLLKQRRADLLEGNTKLDQKEQSMLLKMQSDNLTAKEATALLKQYRTDAPETKKAEFEKKYAQGNILQKGAYNALMLGAGASEKVLQYGGNILDFATLGKFGFGEDVRAMQEVTKSPEFDSTAFKAGKILPDVALAVSPIGGGVLAGAKGASSLALRSGVVGAGFGASQPVLDKGSMATTGDIAKGTAIGGTIGAIAPTAINLIGKTPSVIKKAGEKLYKTAIKPNAQEARALISAEARGATLPTTRADTALKYGIVGTEKGIGVKGVRESEKIFKKTINPALTKSKAEHSVDDLFAKAEQQIAGEKSALRKKELMEGLQALKEDYLATGKKVFSTADLQAEKSMLDEFTPTKVFQGKEVAQGYNQVKNTLANIMREQVRDDLGKVGVKNAKELYRDYANLSALEDVGVKGITEGGLKGGFGTFWSTVYDKIATPVKTVGGKYIYKLGNGIQYVGPKGMDTLGKYLKSKGYKVVGGNIIKLSKSNVKPTVIRSGILLGSPTSGMGGDTLN